jgi:hypothetical protein
MNWAQEILLNDPHPFKIILKARQIGITTFYSILWIDEILWGKNLQSGIIAHTLDDAQNIFADKLKFAYDNLDARVRNIFSTIGDSAKELSFKHGSLIRVGTSLRSSTLQFLHISEFGKICAKYPDRAREIITGSLNTVHPGQSIVIESTAEGKEGKFYEMCEAARAKKDQDLTCMDFKFFFFPWWQHPEYKLETEVSLSSYLKEYFDKLYIQGIHLTDQQKWWYTKKHETQGEDMLREYPSTPDEAFASSQEGSWYAREMKDLYEAGRVTNVSWDKALPVHTAWDLGQADYQVIWFFQVNRSGDINLIDFFQKNNTNLSETAAILKSKPYVYGTHIWPHDANARGRGGITFVDQAKDLDLFGVVLEPHAKLAGINLVKTTLSRCWFDKIK